MSKRDVFYCEVYKDGDLWLPDDEEERKQAARRVFGARMVGCIDVGIETAERILAEHDEFAEFTDEQKGQDSRAGKPHVLRDSFLAVRTVGSLTTTSTG